MTKLKGIDSAAYKQVVERSFWGGWHEQRKFRYYHLSSIWFGVAICIALAFIVATIVLILDGESPTTFLPILGLGIFTCLLYFYQARRMYLIARESENEFNEWWRNEWEPLQDTGAQERE